MTGWRYQAGYFLADYKAEAVHHGPSFNPTGKIDFNCDMASTYFFLLPGNAEGALLNILGLTTLLAGFGLAISTVVVPIFLMLGGSFLLIRSPERNYQMVMLAALVSGVGLVIAAFLAIATTAI